MVEDRGAAEDTAEHAASFLLVARILYSFIQYYGLFFIELSLHGGASFSSVAFLCASLTLLLTFLLFLETSRILLQRNAFRWADALVALGFKSVLP